MIISRCSDGKDEEDGMDEKDGMDGAVLVDRRNSSRTATWG